MALLDDWGDEIQNVPDQGVFSESALGDSAVTKGFPNTMPQQFPYAPTPDKQIHQVDANKFVLYGSPAQAAFPGQPVAMGQLPIQQATAGVGQLPIQQATAGMGDVSFGGYGYEEGDLTRWLEGELGVSPTPSVGAPTGGFMPSPFTKTATPTTATGQQAAAGTGWDALNPLQRAGLVTGIIDNVVDSTMGAVGGAFQIREQAERSRMEMQQMSEMFNAQMNLLNRQIAGATGSQADELRQLLTQAQAAQGNPEQMAMMLAAMQRATRSPWPWIVGGVVALGLGGLIIWLVTREK